MSTSNTLVLVLCACLASTCRGDLVGTQATGSATLPPSAVNQFDPAVMTEPSYCDNTAGTTVTIGNAGYTFCAIFAPAGTGTGAAPAVAMVAAFTGTSLIIQVSLGPQAAWTPFQMTFTDSAFSGLRFVKYTDNFLCAPDGTCGVNASLSGSTITISGGVPPSGGVFNAGFSLTPPDSTLSVIAPPITSTLPSRTFANTVVAWNPVPGAADYTVWIGSEQDDSTVFNSYDLPPSQTSITLPILFLTQPAPNATGSGAAITLWAEVNGVWSATYSSAERATSNLLGASAGADYLGMVQFENLVYPNNGATNVDPFQPFMWVMNGWHDGSTLTIGSAPGASDVFNSGTLQDTQLPHPVVGGSSLQIPGLQPNATYYARLTGPAGWNTPTDVKFTTGLGRAHLITPTDEAQQVPSGNVTFTINPVEGALQYVLWLGTTPGGNDIGQGWPGSATSTTVDLGANTIYYARMWTQQAGGTWNYVDSRFSTYTTNVAFLSFPANGALHALATAVEGPAVPPNTITLGWNPISDATGYTVWVGTSPGANDILDTYQYVLSNNMATVNVTSGADYYVTLWTQKGAQWYYTESYVSTYPSQNPESQYGAEP